jgi:hypothetical protein
MFKKIENAKVAVATYIRGQPKLVIYGIILGITLGIAIALNSGVATLTPSSSFVGTFSISNVARAQVSQSDWLIYTAPDFNISYPFNWIKQPDITTCCGDGETYLPYSKSFTCGGGGCSSNRPPEVDVTTKPQGSFSLEAVYENRIGDINNIRDHTFTNYGDTSLNGIPSKFIDYTLMENVGPGPLGPVQYHEIITIDNGQVYDISYSAQPNEWSTYTQVVSQMINSFQPRLVNNNSHGFIVVPY